MSSRRPSLVAAVVLLWLVVPAAWAQRITPRIVNGSFTSADASTVAVLEGADAATATTYCSGTLVGCRTVVTAAHCVCRDSDTGATCVPDPGRRFVFLQHAGFAAVERIVVRPDFAFPVGDVAVLTLAAPVTGVAPTPLAGAVPAFGTPGTVIGFGRSNGNDADYGLKRRGSVTVGACPAGVSGDTSVCWAFDGTGSNTCNGDSGGPLFVEEAGRTVLAGVTSGGESDTCLAPDQSYDASIAAYRDWIVAEAAPDDLDVAACGDLPSAGEAGTTLVGFAGALAPGTDTATHAIDVPAGTTRLRITLNGRDDGGFDPDLAIAPGAAPTDATAACRSTEPTTYGACEIADPASGAWYATVQRAFGDGEYQLTATAFGVGSGYVASCGNGVREGGEICDGTDASACANGCLAGCTCDPTPACAAGRVVVERLRLGRTLRLSARLLDGDGELSGVDPRQSRVLLALDDGTRSASVTIPLGDGGWSSRAVHGVWRWRGTSGGSGRIVATLKDRTRRRGVWLVKLRGRDVDGTGLLDPGATRVALTLGGRCLGD